MITYQVERFADTYEEALPLLRAHWEEVGVNKEAVPFDPDVAGYHGLEGLGMLHVLTCRDAGKIVGYHVSLVKTHLHYASTLVAFTDIYYLSPAQRAKPRAAVRLFQETERTLRKRGVRLIISTTKVELDISRLFRYLGYLETDKVFMKVLQE
jgi:hypothetical protein